MHPQIKAAFESHLKAVEVTLNEAYPAIEKACEILCQTLRNGNKILLAGNGGSAADAQHIAAELVCRFETARKALPAIALTTDTSLLTAIGNDLGYRRLFARQLEALADPGDLFIAVSTSGNSENILEAIQTASQKGCFTLLLGGKGGGAAKGRCDLEILVPSDNTARIQEVHILIGHILAQGADDCVG